MQTGLELVTSSGAWQVCWESPESTADLIQRYVFIIDVDQARTEAMSHKCPIGVDAPEGAALRYIYV